jgi:plasmid stability protein
MPLLQVRNCPDDIYEKLSLAARRENRTIDQQAIVVLMNGLDQQESNKERRRRVLAEIATRKVPDAVKAVDEVALIREDRER